LNQEFGGIMTCYAVGLLHDIKMGPDIVAYLEGIDATLVPFNGHFIIHGGPKHVLEGDPSSDLIVIAFPSAAEARSWYDSLEYRAIVGLRTSNASGDVFLIEGVGPEHSATDILR
jgi:uncharacterized protein (DUF1330 family)